MTLNREVRAHMGWGLLFAVLAAACTAGATILQAVGVRHVRQFEAVNPRLLLSVTRQVTYMLGLAALAAAFVLTLLALRDTALFVVQGLSAASIAVIAAVSAVVFRARLHWVEWSAVAAVCGGVTLLVITQRPSSTPHLPPIGAWAVLMAAVGIAVLALTSHKWLNGAAIPGLLAGLAFGDAAVASRMIADLDNSFVALVASPATYAVVVSGLIGTLLYATALQRGSVTAVFGLATVGQTIGPAIIGWLLLGDSVHHGTAPLAGVGFVLAVVGALVLGRHAQPECMMPRPVAAPVTVTVPVDERVIAHQVIAKREAAHQRNVRGLARVIVVLRLIKRVALMPWRKRRPA
jgi:drug/metabolite transporter (DMT)-like permease